MTKKKKNKSPFDLLYKTDIKSHVIPCNIDQLIINMPHKVKKIKLDKFDLDIKNITSDELACYINSMHSQDHHYSEYKDKDCIIRRTIKDGLF